MIRFQLIVSICLWSTGVFATYTTNIKNGTIMGMTMVSSVGREFAAFRGVPYALPPIGPWRFEPPQPHTAWDRIHYTKFDAKKCMHQNVFFRKDYVEGDEDCLYLNIYTPKVDYSSNQTDPQYPVMVWFHGSSWSTGSGHSMHYGPNFLLNHDVVLVTVNYRLGPFGFLSTGDWVVPGNMGLKDQVQALRWIQENIETFDGNPNSVTIFGTGTGGASVHYLMISPLAKGLFHRAISQSGTAKNPWALNTAKMAKQSMRRLAKDVKCPSDNSEKAIECLRKVDAMKIATAELEWPVFDLDPLMPFRPVVEETRKGAFITKEPGDIDDLSEVSDVPWIVGTNSHEGAFRTASIYGQRKKGYVDELEEKFTKIAPLSLGFEANCPSALHSKVAKKIKRRYLNEKKIDNTTRDAVTEMYSDALFNIGIVDAVKKHFSLASAPIYYYHLAHDSEVTYAKYYGDRRDIYGVAHGDEVQYLFPVHDHLFPHAVFKDDDFNMSDLFTTLWFNFASTGNPMTPKTTHHINTEWKPISSDQLEYLHIGGPRNLTMSKNPFKDQVEFWRGLPCRAGLAPSRHFANVPIQDEL